MGNTRKAACGGFSRRRRRGGWVCPHERPPHPWLAWLVWDAITSGYVDEARKLAAMASGIGWTGGRRLV